MSELQHRRRVGPVSILSGPCEPDCPACAEERVERIRVADGVREIALGMWLEAIEADERSVETALREIQGPLSLLDAFERGRVLQEFTRRALEIKPRKLPAGMRKPRSLPSSWDKANHELVDLVAKDQSLPKNNTTNVYEAESVFPVVAAIWHEWKIPVNARQVQDAYYDHGRRLRANS